MGRGQGLDSLSWILHIPKHVCPALKAYQCQCTLKLEAIALAGCVALDNGSSQEVDSGRIWTSDGTANFQFHQWMTGQFRFWVYPRSFSFQCVVQIFHPLRLRQKLKWSPGAVMFAFAVKLLITNSRVTEEASVPTLLLTDPCTRVCTTTSTSETRVTLSRTKGWLSCTMSKVDCAHTQHTPRTGTSYFAVTRNMQVGNPNNGKNIDHDFRWLKDYLDISLPSLR